MTPETSTEAEPRSKRYLATPDVEQRSKIGREMGAKTSEAKRRAVRVNGRSGGRPILLGLLGRKDDPYGERIKVSYSRSWGAIVFTYPDGRRETFDECRCGGKREALQLCRSWWKFHRTLEWFPIQF